MAAGLRMMASRKLVLLPVLLLVAGVCHAGRVSSKERLSERAYLGDRVRHRTVDNPPPVSLFEELPQRRVYVSGSDLRFHANTGQTDVNFASKVNGVQRQGQNCYTVPSYTYFNISNNSYYYPQNNINQELTDRKDVLEQIFKDGVKATSPSSEKSTLYAITSSDVQSSVGDGIQKNGDYGGCVGQKLLLRSFDYYGGHCWLVYPRHQAKSFVSCGAPKCQGLYGQYSACAVEEVTEGVWAWCETLPYGKRITKIYLPLPVSCKCRVYDC